MNYEWISLPHSWKYIVYFLFSMAVTTWLPRVELLIVGFSSFCSSYYLCPCESDPSVRTFVYLHNPKSARVSHNSNVPNNKYKERNTIDPPSSKSRTYQSIYV